MSKVVFRDFDEFADALKGVAGCFVPTAPSETDWWLQVVPVGRIVVQQIQIGGAVIFAGGGADNSINLGIPTTESRRIRIDGNAMQDNSVIAIRENQPFTFAARHATRWASLCVPMDHPLLSDETLDSLNEDSRSDGGNTLRQTDLLRVAQARQLAARICEHDSDIELDSATAVRAAEEEVVTLTARALEASIHRPRPQIWRRRFSRGRIVARALSLMEESQGRPVLIQDLCRAAQVSERTLRNVFQEFFHVSPMRLLKFRQLHEIRAALRNADPDQEKVANIAARFGVWDFSTFTRSYKALYGETPSETLRRIRPARSRWYTERMVANMSFLNPQPSAIHDRFQSISSDGTVSTSRSRGLFAMYGGFPARQPLTELQHLKRTHAREEIAADEEGVLSLLSSQFDELIQQQRKLNLQIEQCQAELRDAATWARDLSRSQSSKIRGDA